MVRFHVDSSIANDSALRAARGAHLIFFEDGDAAASLRLRAPWLSWSNDAGDPSIPYAEFADFTLRIYARLNDTRVHFFSHAVTFSARKGADAR